jgi:mannose-6-phosphate isomerase-like protein (cupin superfamily)
MYHHTSNKYELCKNVLLTDLLQKISNECSVQSHRLIVNERLEPLFILHNDFYPGSIKLAFDEVSNDCGVKVLHIYTSFSENAPTFGRHCDKTDVLIVQSFGRVKYKFDDESIVEMNPGDAIYIPKGIYHDPISFEPRVTLSFSWE